MSQAALASAVGLDRSHISKMESGAIALPDEDTRAKFHREFGTTEDDLVKARVLEVIQIPGQDPVYLPARPLIPPAQDPQAHRAIAETDERYDAIDPRYRLRLRAEALTESQAEAILSLIDAFTGHDR